MHYWKFIVYQTHQSGNILRKMVFEGSLIGDKFSTKHENLITETTVNREVKVRPMDAYKVNIVQV